MNFEKRVQKIVEAFCRWNMSNIYEPQNSKTLKYRLLNHVARLAIDSGEWKKYRSIKIKKNKKVLLR